MKELLLDQVGDPEESVKALAEHITGLLGASHGEVLFDLGLKDSGDSMSFSGEDWTLALSRLKQAADVAKADCRLLMSRNVGGEVDVGPANPKDKDASGKLMIRRRPETVDDVIETRIAVVGNGMSNRPLVKCCSDFGTSRRW